MSKVLAVSRGVNTSLFKWIPRWDKVPWVGVLWEIVRLLFINPLC